MADHSALVTPDLIRGPSDRCGYGSRIKSGMTKIGKSVAIPNVNADIPHPLWTESH